MTDIIDSLWNYVKRILDIPYMIYYAIGGVLIILYITFRAIFF